MTAQSLVQIKKMSVDITLSQWGASPQQKSLYEFQRAIRSELSDVLSDLLQPLDNAGEGLLFIKRLEVDCELDLSTDRKHLFRFLAAAIRNNLVALMNSSQLGYLALFASEREYYARFLCDLMEGRAWQHWYYQRFDGLRALPLSAAIRTCLLNEPQALPAAFTLPHHISATLSSILSEQDCNTILQVIHQRNARDFSTPATGQMETDEFNALLPIIFQRLDVHCCHNLLRTQLYLALTTTIPDKKNTAHLPDHGVRALISLKHYQLHHNEAEVQYLTTALHDGDQDRVRALITNTEWIELCWIFSQPRARIAAITSALHKPAASASVSNHNVIAGRFTPFGNILFLLQHMNELPLADWFGAWPDCDGADAVNLFTLLAICDCQGPGKFHSAFKDSLVQDLCGVKTATRYPLSFSRLSEWLNALPMDIFHALNKQMKNHILDMVFDTRGRASSRTLVIEQEQQQFQIHVDSKRNHWLCLAIEPVAVSNTQLNSSVKNLDIPPQTEADLEFLWNALPAQLATHGMTLTCVLAHYSFRRFAMRLPGFSQSSLTYLLQNFLAMTLTLKEKDHFFSARLSRVPMSVLLNMTGINRTPVHLPMFDSRPLHLHEQDG